MRQYLALLLFLASLNAVAADDSYYGKFMDVLRTNQAKPCFAITSPALVDTNNAGHKLSSAEINLESLRTNGDFAGIRLGMTMDEVVAVWGKPPYFWSTCGGGPRFNYSDAGLIFISNRLTYVYPYYRNGIKFDHSLAANSSLQEWVRVLGQPTRKESQNRGAAEMVWYDFPRATIRLTFDTNGDVVFSPTLVLPTNAPPQNSTR